MHRTLVLLLFLFLSACHKPVFRAAWVKRRAPEHFTLLFQTSKGEIEAAFTREWSPAAADRLYAQVKHGYYDHTLFYRTRPGFVAQFGGDDTLKMKSWKQIPVPDEPVLRPNIRGAIAFARSGKESRENDLFINTGNNSPRLDTLSVQGVTGYPPFGNVVRGMEIVDALYHGYGDAVFKQYELLLKDKATFLKAFPLLDSIIRVRVLYKR